MKNTNKVAISISRRPRSLGEQCDLSNLESYLSATHNVIPIENKDKSKQDIEEEVRPIIDEMGESIPKSMKRELIFIYADHGDIVDGNSTLTLKDSYMTVNELAQLVQHPNIARYGFIISACRSTGFLSLSDILGQDRCLTIVAAEDYKISSARLGPTGGYQNTDLITVIADGILASGKVWVDLKELNLDYSKNRSRRTSEHSQRGLYSGNTSIYVKNPGFRDSLRTDSFYVMDYLSNFCKIKE